MPWLSPALLWFIVACLLIASEIAFTTVALLFFGLGALAAAALAWLGLGFAWQLAGFMAISAVSLVCLRRRLQGWLNRADREVADTLVGQEVLVLSPITPSAPGQAELNGATWQARSSHSLAAGSRAVIVRHQGLVLFVEPLREGDN